MVIGLSGWRKAQPERVQATKSAISARNIVGSRETSEVYHEMQHMKQ